MDKRTIDQFKESHRQIDLKSNKATIDDIDYTIFHKSFNKGIIELKMYEKVFDGKENYTKVVKFELQGYVTNWNHYLIAMSTINKSDTFFTRLKNRIKIIKYFLFN